MSTPTEYIADSCDVIVIGGGHAGCEAALSTGRRNLKTIMFTINLDSIAMMPCNPNIGGSSKGHLVREIDALGGEMGRNIDKTYIQSRMLNTGKGPAVYSLRAQADKRKYSNTMKSVLENTNNVTIKQNEVVKILFTDEKVSGVLTDSGAIYNCKAIILTTGTYLNARCLYGETISETGPNGLKSSKSLADNLRDMGITMYRFKTGTPARVDGNTVDYSKMEVQNGDDVIVPFSFENNREDITREQIPCYLAYTNENTHNIIKENLHRSPMYSGVILGTGTRYCPSIEDKIVRFADKERHQVFVEPEGEDTTEVYIQGMSTSLPEDVQIAMYRTIKGLENCQFTRAGYAIEYDCIDATELKLSLEFKKLSGLFSAGQFNGSSGYEEAAAQGLIAGINAGQYVLEKEAVIIDRSDGYIGVLIDDLVTKGTKEPYRMMTSRAEYRLLLRQDNADARLSEIGYKVGLISDERYERLIIKKRLINEEVERCRNLVINPTTANKILELYNSTLIISGAKLSDLIKRPELDYIKLKDADPNRPILPEDVTEQVNISLKYEGYIFRQMQQVEQFKKLENRLIPENIDYNDIVSMRLEATQKLSAIRPLSIGHASRITGVSPADISVLMVYLEKFKNR